MRPVRCQVRNARATGRGHRQLRPPCERADQTLLVRPVLTEPKRFTGPQIMRICRKRPEVYANTSRISLVSSFLASFFLGSIAPLDISDVCGMNLWDIPANQWSEPLLELTAGGKDGAPELRRKLGEVRQDGGGSMGSIAPYFVRRYGFSPDCQIAP